MSSNILIIEDEPAIADVLAYALKSEGYQPHVFGLGETGLKALQQNDFDLVILDVGLPDLNGFEVCRRIRNFSEIPVVFLTARSEEIDRVVGLEIGADDYVVKPFSPRELVARVRARLRRITSATNAASTMAMFMVDENSARVLFLGQPLNLTRYEYLLAKQLLQHPGRIYSREFLMDAIWKDALDTSDRTVDTHIKTLRAKLKVVRNDLDPIIPHRGMGYSINTSQ